jgi:hypothetical protein
MSSTYSSSLRIELIGSGEQAGTWGTTTDNNLAYLLDVGIAGYQTVSVTSASQALTYLNGATSSAALNQSVYAMLRFTTTVGATFAVYAPPVSKMYIIYNNSGYSMTLYNSTVIGNTTAAGTGLTIPDGAKYLAFSDGTNFYKTDTNPGTVTSVAVSGGTTGLTTSGGPVTSSGTITLAGTLAIANGGTGQTTQQAAINALAGTQTNNRVLRSDGTNTTLSQVGLTTDVTGTLPVANGGTNATTAQGAINNLAGAVTSGSYLRGNGTNVVMNTIQAADVPTLNQNTSGTAAGLSATLAIGSGGTNSTATPTAGGAAYGTGTAYATTAAGTAGQVLVSNGASAPTWANFVPSGTLMLFQQTSAPSGWTKQTTHNDKALRVVTGAASSGGSSTFSTVFTNQTPTITTSSLGVGATTLTTAMIPSHNHTGATYSQGALAFEGGPGGADTGTGFTGGGGSHTHSVTGSATSSAITLNVQYVDLIIASKD